MMRIARGRGRGLLLAPVLLLACVHSAPETHHPETTTTASSTKGGNETQPVITTTQLPSPTPGPFIPGLPSPKPVPVMVRVMVRSSPTKSLVYWGKKKLGETPVTLDRPRDSGPVDLIVRRVGYFPFHT